MLVVNLYRLWALQQEIENLEVEGRRDRQKLEFVKEFLRHYGVEGAAEVQKKNVGTAAISF